MVSEEGIVFSFVTYGMNIFGWFRSAKEKFHKQATEVTHRAVAHQTTETAVSDVDTSFLTEVEHQTDRDKSFARMFWLT